MLIALAHRGVASVPLVAYEKVGFQKEGVLRQETYRQGRYWNTILMAMLRADWEALQPQRE